MELAGQPIESPHHIYGIDFSRAKDAGKKIRSEKGVLKGKVCRSFPEYIFHAEKIGVDNCNFMRYKLLRSKAENRKALKNYF